MRKLISIALVSAFALSMSVTASAATSSVHQTGPTVTIRPSTSSTSSSGWVAPDGPQGIDDDDSSSSDMDDLTVTTVGGYTWGTSPSSLSTANSATYDSNISTLNEVYDELTSADSIQDVISGLDPDVSYIVKDLFDVSLWDETAKTAQEKFDNGEYVSMTLDIGAVDGVTYTIAMRGSDGTWTVIDPSLITYNGDGTITVMIDGVGIIAVLVDGENTDAGAGIAGDSEIITDVADESAPVSAAVAAACTAAALGVFFAVDSRRKKQ